MKIFQGSKIIFMVKTIQVSKVVDLQGNQSVNMERKKNKYYLESGTNYNLHASLEKKKKSR